MASPYHSKPKVLLDDNGLPIVIFKDDNFEFKQNYRSALLFKFIFGFLPTLYYFPASLMVTAAFFQNLQYDILNYNELNWFNLAILICCLSNFFALNINIKILYCILRGQKISRFERSLIWFERFGILLYFATFSCFNFLGFLMIWGMQHVLFFPGFIPIIPFIASFAFTQLYNPE